MDDPKGWEKESVLLSTQLICLSLFEVENRNTFFCIVYPYMYLDGELAYFRKEVDLFDIKPTHNISIGMDIVDPDTAFRGLIKLVAPIL